MKEKTKVKLSSAAIAAALGSPPVEPATGADSLDLLDDTGTTPPLGESVMEVLSEIGTEAV